jgi:hypothetical protein
MCWLTRTTAAQQQWPPTGPAFTASLPVTVEQTVSASKQRIQLQSQITSMASTDKMTHRTADAMGQSQHHGGHWPAGRVATTTALSDN